MYTFEQMTAAFEELTEEQQERLALLAYALAEKDTCRKSSDML